MASRAQAFASIPAQRRTLEFHHEGVGSRASSGNDRNVASRISRDFFRSAFTILTNNRRFSSFNRKRDVQVVLVARIRPDVDFHLEASRFILFQLVRTVMRKRAIDRASVPVSRRDEVEPTKFLNRCFARIDILRRIDLDFSLLGRVRPVNNTRPQCPRPGRPLPGHLPRFV